MRLVYIPGTSYQQSSSRILCREFVKRGYTPALFSQTGGGLGTRPREIPTRRYTRACPNLLQNSILTRWQNDHEKEDAEHPHPFFFGRTPQVVV